MTVCFTVCSNNYLAQAGTMITSLKKHHPELDVFLFLVDKPDPGINYSDFSIARVTFVSEELVPGYEKMIERYSVIELNTAIRPFLYKYLAKNEPGIGNVIYIDPDMYVYHRMDHVMELLQNNDIILTPHFVEPVPNDGKKPFEDIALTYGIFNVGFLALNIASPNTKRFIEWWGERTFEFGYTDLSRGLFTDQIWFNLVPVFFEKVFILKHKGYNMAIWNLHERRIGEFNGDKNVKLENGEPLVIYHFSNWNYFKPEILSGGFDRYDFSNRTDLWPLYQHYYLQLKESGHDRYLAHRCLLPVRKLKRNSKVKNALAPGIQFMKKIWHRI